MVVVLVLLVVVVAVVVVAGWVGFGRHAARVPYCVVVRRRGVERANSHEALATRLPLDTG